VALLTAALGVSLFLYGPALQGPFVSDDLHYVAGNPYVQELSARHVIEILDPFGPATILVVNWTPVHLLLHAAAWSLFGPDVGGHHVLNVVIHAIASVLLTVLLARSGLPLPAATLGGALFLVHPANVEAVAWISQLKTSSAMLLALLALLLWPRRPGLGGGRLRTGAADETGRRLRARDGGVSRLRAIRPRALALGRRLGLRVRAVRSDRTRHARARRHPRCRAPSDTVRLDSDDR